MNIGIDIDEVLASMFPTLLEWHNREYGTKVGYHDCTSYKLWEVWGGTKDEAIDKTHEFFLTTDFRNIKPIHGAQEGVEVLSKLGEIVAITSRPEVVYDETMAFLYGYFAGKFTTHNVHFTNQWNNNNTKSTTKSAICKRLGIDILIEDHLDYVVECSPVIQKAYLLNAPYNQTDELPDNAIRVYGWEQLTNIVTTEQGFTDGE